MFNKMNYTIIFELMENNITTLLLQRNIKLNFDDDYFRKLSLYIM